MKIIMAELPTKQKREQVNESEKGEVFNKKIAHFEEKKSFSLENAKKVCFSSKCKVYMTKTQPTNPIQIGMRSVCCFGCILGVFYAR